eukprot:13837337-Alexandrium_andersonii.AAC.1
MSASLVGSEMCIRDRAQTDPMNRSFHWQMRNLHEKWCRTHPSGASGTVSYTHLTLPTICSV